MVRLHEETSRARFGKNQIDAGIANRPSRPANFDDRLFVFGVIDEVRGAVALQDEDFEQFPGFDASE